MAGLTLAFVRYTSCSGCQLMLANCEEQLVAIAALTDWHGFDMISSRPGDGVPVEVALVEGSISTPSELESLLALRERARYLVAVGACALSGGVNALARIGREAARGTFPPQPVYRFVRVDGEIPGCPPERSDLLALLGALRLGGWPGHLECAVCMECRIRENRCLLLEDRLPCLGPVTRAGCRARCPSINVACEGCRGEVAEAHRDEAFRLLAERGLPAREVRRRLERFQGDGDA
jgi:coenzyme F420-reducing hydrogenase gamma subunit